MIVSPIQEPPPLLDEAVVSQHRLRQLRAIDDELGRREIEALNLYEPLPFQQEYHACRAPEVCFVKGNQVGASLAGFVEVARAITGKDPHNKYPQRDGTAVCLGMGEKHIGRVIYKYLFRAGAFRIIRDLETNEWRTFRPWPPDQVVCGHLGDGGREAKSKPAPPLIPHRFIDGKISWEKRSENVFRYIKFKTGWELYAENSAGDPGQVQGFQCDLYHIDEDVAMGGWLEEATGRLMARTGKLRWTAVPHARLEDLMLMVQRAEEEEESGVPYEQRTTIRIKASIFDNPYLPEASRKSSAERWRSMGEDVYMKRAMGEIVLDSVLMYPTFNRHLHNAIPDRGDLTPIQQILSKRMGEPPLDWCRYMVVDPGHTVCAVTFWATPPPELGDYRVCYDELYLRNCDKFMFARNVLSKVKDRTFQDFIIDVHGGRLREIGSGIHPKRQYEDEMEKHGIVCVAREHRFTAGSDDITGRVEKLREWLSVRPDSTTKLLIVVPRCPNLVREMERFKKKTVRVGGHDVPTDDGNRRMNSHAVETCEYAAAHGLPYITPPSPRKEANIVRRIIKQRKERERQRAADTWDPGKSLISLAPRGA